ncbi:MAG: DUF1080 domain-containing protein [Phycisphaerales bacterium]|nr:DUF1080 domain-containing protein [Phycisphaerales bacterium]MCB9835462.1 DUF1080 domain-containing protein [Phycisphaera sp.]
MKKLAAACMVGMVVAFANAQESDTSWKPLFNGEDLTGWVSTGEPDAWGVENGEIVTVKPGTGGWLRTDRMFRDFELTIDFFMPEGGNSGLGLRGSSGGDPAFTGFEIQMLDTYGEEPGLRNCGSVYEAVAPARMSVNKPGEWNTYRVMLTGDTLNVWLNGEPIHIDTKLDDRGFFRSEENPLPLNTRATTGYIAVQDHGHAFRYRNIKIRDLSVDPEPAGMVQLAPGNIDGWFSRDAGEWTFENGAIVGRNGPGHLFTEKSYTDFELRALVKVNTHGNSGLYFRTVPSEQEGFPWPTGYEAQVDQHDPKNYTGCIYDRAWPESNSGPITQDNAWFDYRIRAEGDHIRTWINGVPFVDTELTNFSEGHFALQSHHPGNEIMYKDVRVLELE